jgi:hypothetical protein
MPFQLRRIPPSGSPRHPSMWRAVVYVLLCLFGSARCLFFRWGFLVISCQLPAAAGRKETKKRPRGRRSELRLTQN